MARFEPGTRLSCTRLISMIPKSRDVHNLTLPSYMANVVSTIAKGQITNGGPVILFQPENEYTYSCCGVEPFPDHEYFQYVIDQARNAGIVVPLINNDASPQGYFAPGSGEGSVDIYGHDDYP